jgi:hypothetical protein
MLRAACCPALANRSPVAPRRLQGGNPAIVVGNAQAELVAWLSRQPQQDGRIVYSDALMARGILEGLSRHGLY